MDRDRLKLLSPLFVRPNPFATHPLDEALLIAAFYLAGSDCQRLGFKRIRSASTGKLQ